MFKEHFISNISHIFINPGYNPLRVGNLPRSVSIISGQVAGDTAKKLSERFGKIMQDRASYSINSADTSVSHCTQLESAIPPSKISALSSGEFVGMVADDSTEKIE